MAGDRNAAHGRLRSTCGTYATWSRNARVAGFRPLSGVFRRTRFLQGVLSNKLSGSAVLTAFTAFTVTARGHDFLGALAVRGGQQTAAAGPAAAMARHRRRARAWTGAPAEHVSARPAEPHGHSLTRPTPRSPMVTVSAHWHGPHESQTAARFADGVAVGAVVAGLFGIRQHSAAECDGIPERALPRSQRKGEGVRRRNRGSGRSDVELNKLKRKARVELGLMVFSVIVASSASRLRGSYSRPEISTQRPGDSRVRTGCFITIIRRRAVQRNIIDAKWASARGLWTVDRDVVDGAVNGRGGLTSSAPGCTGRHKQSSRGGESRRKGHSRQPCSSAACDGTGQNYALLCWSASSSSPHVAVQRISGFEFGL